MCIRDRFSAVGCGSKDAAADTTTAEPAAEETTEASDDAAAADTASDADGFYAGKTVEMIVPLSLIHISSGCTPRVP